jgi:dolichol-phosphate mannosyltransferase
MLGVPMRDATGGYRAFRADTLRKIDLVGVESAGYCFQVELGWRAVKAGMRVREVPIEFVERELGDSKMNQRIVAEALWRVTLWGAQDKARKARRLLAGKRSGGAGW